MKHNLPPELIVNQRIRENLDLKRALLNDLKFQSLLVKAGDALTRVLKAGAKVMFFGNGGSAADAQHLAAELVGKFMFQRRALPGLALTGNSSSLTAIANDDSFDNVFARQVESFGFPGDAAIGITTSGRSRNVLRGLDAARNLGLVTVALTGCNGELLENSADYCLCIPSEDTARIQEAHILIGHILCEIMERGVIDEPSGLS